jgi:NAD-dependent DNA ligase
MQQSKTEQERLAAAQAERDRQEARAKEVALARQIRELNKLIHDKEDTVDIPAIRKDWLKAGGAKLAEVLNKEEWLGEEFSKKLEKEAGVKLAAREYKCLTEMYSDLFVALEATVSQLNFLRIGKLAAMADLDTEKANARKIIQEKEDEITKLRREKQAEINKGLEAAKNFDAEKRRLLEQNEATLAEKTKVEEAAAITEARIRSEVSRLEARIAELTEKKKRTMEETEADGEVVHADARLGLAWVNLGVKDRVRRGTTFEVFQYVKGGARKVKGHIEIKTVDDAMSQAAVLHTVDSTDPIVKGDLIASPFYDKHKTMNFVLVGKPKNERYSLDELVRRIEEEGGRVDKSISIDTDFMVAMEEADQSEEFAKAVQLGVIVMREQELMEFLGR